MIIWSFHCCLFVSWEAGGIVRSRKILEEKLRRRAKNGRGGDALKSTRAFGARFWRLSRQNCGLRHKTFTRAKIILVFLRWNEEGNAQTASFMKCFYWWTETKSRWSIVLSFSMLSLSFNQPLFKKNVSYFFRIFILYQYISSWILKDVTAK